MLTGMPISIALGLTVLTFVFTMTQVPIESVALKLFTGIERFEIMAIPFFILAGTFLTHGGVARRMINFAASMVGHWHGGLALAGIVACAMFALVCGSSVATVVAIGSIVLPEMVRRGFPMEFGAGGDHRRGLARHTHAAIDPQGHLRHRHQHVDRRAIRRRAAARDHADDDALFRDLVHRQEAWLPAHAAGKAGPRAGSCFAKASGA